MDNLASQDVVTTVTTRRPDTGFSNDQIGKIMISATQTKQIKVSPLQNAENALHKLPSPEEQNISATQTRNTELLHETT